MRTTILAYVIAVLGFVMIVGGVYSFFVLWNDRATLRHYAMTVGMICGGFAMGGIAQALLSTLSPRCRAAHFGRMRRLPSSCGCHGRASQTKCTRNIGGA